MNTAAITTALEASSAAARPEERVLVRAFRGEPLLRIVVGTGVGVVFVASPASAHAVLAGDRGAIGFPAEHVFEADPLLMARLEAASEGERRRLWEGAKRYRRNSDGCRQSTGGAE